MSIRGFKEAVRTMNALQARIDEITAQRQWHYLKDGPPKPRRGEDPGSIEVWALDTRNSVRGAWYDTTMIDYDGERIEGFRSRETPYVYSEGDIIAWMYRDPKPQPPRDDC